LDGTSAALRRYRRSQCRVVVDGRRRRRAQSNGFAGGSSAVVPDCRKAVVGDGRLVARLRAYVNVSHTARVNANDKVPGKTIEL